MKHIHEWNQTGYEFSAELSVHCQFEQIAERFPQAVVLTHQNQSITYEELNGRSNILAHQLRSKGIGPDTFVAILMDRSIEMLVAILGILKAGGAYVPLDSAYPQERLAFMLADTQAAVLITQTHLKDRLAHYQNALVIMDANWGAEETSNRGNLQLINDGEHVAYVMYTSGSTGRPKGVMIPHRAILRLVLGANYAKLDTNTVSLQLAPVSFDASTLEIWGPLLNGGRCVLYPKSGTPDMRDLKKVISKNGVNVLWLTASLFNNIIAESLETITGVDQILTGGEALSVHHMRLANEKLPDSEFINGYGPTECTTFATTFSIPKSIPNDWKSIPIGRPIVNTQVYVLDEQRQPVPIGEQGELYIGGLGVARGYLNLPELTQERFVPNPFAEDSSAKLYKTGDEVRFLEDGRIDFIGRKDDQIKLRGYRIELGEIEFQLNKHDCLIDAKVVMHQDDVGNKQLAAYVIHKEDEITTVSELRRFLGENLPDYMIPSLFVFVESFPLTVNGKLDHAQLPAPGGKRPQIDQPYVAPRNRVEKWLAKLWQELLNLDKVGVQDRFFELGGDSLRAGQFVNQIQKELGITIPIVAIYQAYSIEKFAEMLQNDFGDALTEKLNLRGGRRERKNGRAARQARLERRKQSTNRAGNRRRERLARTRGE
jgi:amino acid adenylation domain-containing protein